MTLTAYDRRPSPTPTFTPDQKAWVDVETAHIKAAIDDTQGAIPAPQTINAKILAADVTNNSSTTHQAMGLTVSVNSGVRTTVRWTVFVVSGATDGIVLELSHPGLSGDFLRAWYSNTGVGVMAATFVTSTGASPIFITNVVSYSGNGYVQVEAALVPSANGAVDLLFRPNLSPNLKTVKAGSLVEWWT